MKTYVYVDGFNLYYGNLKGTPHKWLDLEALFRRLLPPGHELAKIKYFTARVSALPNDRDAPRRQDVYLRALRNRLGDLIEIVEGEFLIKKARLPMADNHHHFVEVMRPEEKGSDVNLAVELVNDSWEGSFDCAAIASNDADLARALRIVKQQRKKKVLLFTPGSPIRTPLSCLNRWAHKQIGIKVADVAAAQFPDQIPGTTLIKPAGW